MTIREKLHAEIDNIDDRDLDAVYKLVREYTETQSTAEAQTTPETEGLLAKLSKIKIDGPPDLSINLDHYLYGVERVSEDLH